MKITYICKCKEKVKVDITTKITKPQDIKCPFCGDSLIIEVKK
jgi:DNA-directed RNA polymerase subunit RPC12/RpoP